MYTPDLIDREGIYKVSLLEMGEKIKFLEYNPLWYLTNMDTSAFPIAEPYPYEDENCI